MIGRMIGTCQACGEAIGDREDRKRRLSMSGNSPHYLEWLYCEECADEKLRGLISLEPARLFSSGAGCPLEPSNDAGPWQEANIRILEDG